MKVEELAERLVPFGLTTTESLVYYHLCRLGTARAAEVAKVAGLKRTDVYSVMESLARKGAVERTLERPFKFIPVPLKRLLEVGLENERNRVTQLAEEAAVTESLWPKPQGAKAPSSERLAIHQGRAQVEGLLRRMAESAKEELVLVLPKRFQTRLELGVVWDRLTARGRDIVIRIVAEIDDETKRRFLWLAEAAQVRHVDVTAFYAAVIADSREIALAFSSASAQGTTSTEPNLLWLSSPEFVMAQKALFEHLWEVGTPLAERLAELERHEAPTAVAVHRGRWARTDLLLTWINEAQREIHIVPTKEEQTRGRSNGIEVALAKAAARGVTLNQRSWPPLAAPVLSGVSAYQVDDRLLVVLNSDDRPGSATFDGEWSIRVQFPALANLLSRLLEGRAATTVEGAPLEQPGQAMNDRLKEIERLNQRLEQRNRFLDDFAHIVGHDLKAPLRGIALQSQLLEESLGAKASQDQRERFEALRDRLLKMDRLIDAILQYSRAGRQTERAVDVDLTETLNEIRTTFMKTFDQEMVFARPAPRLHAPPTQLKQVFQNLIGNALKYHDRVEGKVWVNWQDLGDRYLFVIEDDGPGIPDALLERLFVPFGIQGPQHDSSGIGLALTKRLIEVNDGSIMVERRQPRGTAVKVEWPKAGLP